MSIISASTLTNTALQYTADTTGTLVFKTGATPTTAMTIGADQSVTFAGATVYTGLAVFGSGSTLGGATNPIVAMTGAANNYIQSYIYNNTNGVNSSADFVAYANNSTDASGWVDMGYTSASYAQAAYSVTGPNEAYIFASAPSGASKTGNLVLATDSTGTANAIQFYTGGFNQAKSAAKMTIDSSGNVGVSVTPSAWSVVGPVIQFTNGGFVGSQGSSNTFYVGNNHYYNGTNFIYTTTGYATQYQSGGGTGSHLFFSAPSGTAGTTATMTQVLKFGKGVSVALEGAATQTGTGISFPATQSASSDANTLDDYEEGTWTPTWTASGTNPTVTYSGQSGYYIKIGSLVFFTCRITVSTASGGSGGLRLSGLPFIESSGPIGWYPASQVGYKNGWSTNGPDYGRVVGTFNELYKSNNTGETSISPSNLGAGTDFIMSGVYNA